MRADLAQRIAGGCAVVTPNRRLAASLKHDYDAIQAAAGKAVWPTADILPFSAYVARAYEDALYSAHGADLPVLLAPAQELALWETLIRDSEAGRSLLAVPETAALARDAWQLVHAWELAPRLAKFPANDDARAFREWAQRYEAVTRRDRHTDAARLAGVVASRLALPAVRKPKALVHFGFDLVMPQQAAFFRALSAAGCEVSGAGPEPRDGARLRLECADNLEEIRRAAAWARARLESGAARIGVVVPDLAKHRSAIQRVFSAVMEPDYALPGRRHPVLPFNISLGGPLASWPLVNAAFLALELAGREIDFERASRLIRSPFLAGAESEFARRARLDGRLRETAEPVVTLDRLITLIAREDGAACPVLAQRLGALAEFRKARLFGGQAPSTWARAFSEALAAIGFPGERGLDSAEFQTLAKWHEAVAGFAALDRVIPRMGYADAVSRLRRMAADTLFQPESPEVPIQVLGELEATGMTFDCLWVMGLSDEAWPRAPRPNPFLPVELQRAAAMPQGSAAGMLEQARRLTAEWLSCADAVILSHPRREDDREFKPSPLIAAVPAGAPDLPEYSSYRGAVHDLRDISRDADVKALPLAAAAVHGGTSVIRDQAACPFRAFARHRLGAESLAAPHAGLDALERGTLVHRVLAQVWAQLKTKRALEAIADADLDALLAKAADDAVARVRRERPTVLSGRFAGIEKRRLARLAREWLEQEKRRGDFTVLATEDKRAIGIGGLAFNARLDRVDEVEGGRRIVIDYKTGTASAGALVGVRPDEPQLPLYLISAEPDAVAVAFAQVRAGDMKFTTLARDADVLPDARTLPDGRLKQAEVSWAQQVEAWRADLARIAAGFASGDAAVDPKQYPHTCRYCDVKPFCRIYERLENALEGDAE